MCVRVGAAGVHLSALCGEQGCRSKVLAAMLRPKLLRAAPTSCKRVCVHGAGIGLRSCPSYNSLLLLAFFFLLFFFLLFLAAAAAALALASASACKAFQAHTATHRASFTQLQKTAVRGNGPWGEGVGDTCSP